MTKYTWDGLPGGEVELIGELETSYKRPGIKLSDGTVVYVPRDLLTEVKPPLPPEPPVGSVVRNRYNQVYVRSGRETYPWSLAGGVGTYDWVHVLAKGPGWVAPVLLVPDPLAEAPDLPYAHVDWEGDTVTVRKTKSSTDIAIETANDIVFVDRNFALAVLKATSPEA